MRTVSIPDCLRIFSGVHTLKVSMANFACGITFGLFLLSVVRPALSVLTCNGACTNEFMGFRLCDGGGTGVCSPTQGRLEYNFNGCSWGTVCDDDWNNGVDPNANVACHMFGYSSGTASWGAPFGAGTGPIWFDDFDCAGTELSLLDCPYLPQWEENCGHDEDVGVICVP